MVNRYSRGMDKQVSDTLTGAAFMLGCVTCCLAGVILLGIIAALVYFL